MFFLCVAGALLNVALHLLATGEDLLPLYLDTVFTITVTLLCGPVWGCLTGALTNIISHTNNFWGWEGYLFALCNIATALVTWQFIRFFPKELNLIQIQHDNKHSFSVKSRQLDNIMNRIIILTLLSFALCLVISILGGLISAFIEILRSTAVSEAIQNPASPPNTQYDSIPLVLREIISRIPINIIDRLISAFLGFFIALALSILGKKIFFPIAKK